MPREPEPIVFVVDDDRAMRDSLRWLLESIGLSVRTYPTAADFLSDHDPAQPGCLVLDVRMPGMSGLDLQTELANRGSELPTIVVTGHAEVAMAVRAVKAGALDFIEKPFSDQLLLDRVRQALEIDRQSREVRVRREDARRRLASLSAREREVLSLVAAGKANKEVAAALRLSPKTVEVHRAHVMSKMAVDSLAELIRVAILAGAIG
ncbi:MAG TPA: response regulator [Candidatus Binatia bacterium]|nr:response regulator [Candidatus Binatia bacterium]